ncbi:glycosyl hydrolase family 3 domain protein [Escherichia coli 8-415-05_S4_C2]|nr:glycosyl hydrolase family 3 domain protein [Escherichia coli 8-415-05_S4_C2]
MYDNSASEYFENSDNKLSILFLSPSCLWQTTVFAPFSLPRRATEEEKSI